MPLPSSSITMPGGSLPFGAIRRPRRGIRTLLGQFNYHGIFGIEWLANARELKQNAAAIPDASWIGLTRDRFSLEAGEKASGRIDDGSVNPCSSASSTVRAA